MVPWCWVVRFRAGAETASPGVCHWLMKMDLELLGDGVEKDGKKRTRSPLALFPPRFPWDRGVP